MTSSQLKKKKSITDRIKKRLSISPAGGLRFDVNDQINITLEVSAITQEWPAASWELLSTYVLYGWWRRVSSSSSSLLLYLNLFLLATAGASLPAVHHLSLKHSDSPLLSKLHLSPLPSHSEKFQCMEYRWGKEETESARRQHAAPHW